MNTIGACNGMVLLS